MPRHKFTNKRFVHWHNHSEYSSFDGVSKITDLVKYARMMGFPAIAITDHGNVGSTVKFLEECSATKDKNGDVLPYDPIMPIIGCEFYFCRQRDWKTKKEYEERVAEAKKKGKSSDHLGYQSDGRKGNRHLNLYAKNWEGYKNLCTLSQISWVDGVSHKDPRIDIDDLAAHSKGLMLGSACLSSIINANLLRDRYDEAKKALGIFIDIFGLDSLFLEAMYHGIAEEKAILPGICKLSKETGVPILATNDCHYIRKDQAKSHEVLMCMSTSNCLTNDKHMHFPYDEFYMKSAEEMGKIFGHVPQMLDNTYAMMERIDTKDIISNMFGGMKLPKFALPEGYNDPFKYMVHVAKDGMRKLGWDKSVEHIECLKKELRDIQVAKEMNNYDFSTYFLIVWDYMNYAKKQGIVTGCGRGSGYASILLRALGITYGPDPLKYNLLWERFLGFDDRRFIRAEDFGFPEIVEGGLPAVVVGSDEDLEEERVVEEDFGGVDRY